MSSENPSLSVNSQTPQMQNDVATQGGGAKRRASTKKVTRKSSQKVVRKTDKKSTKQNEKNSSQEKNSFQDKKGKKGGSFISDVQNLAVPFAILLAKEGLSKAFKKDDKESKKIVSSSMSPKTASRTSSTRRRTTMSGGSCNLACGAMTGGRAARELFQLQKEIDNFLEKY